MLQWAEQAAMVASEAAAAAAAVVVVVVVGTIPTQQWSPFQSWR
jgi:hypothetical protein